MSESRVCPECGESGMLHRAIHAQEAADTSAWVGFAIRPPFCDEDQGDTEAAYESARVGAHHARLALDEEEDL